MKIAPFLTTTQQLRTSPQKRGAWLLLEVVLAMALFSAVVVAFVVALNQTSELSLVAQQNSQIIRLMEGALMEASTVPTLSENIYDYKIEDLGLDLKVETKPIELFNQDKVQLEDMWLIRVTASWVENGFFQEEVLETWRYGKMYQP